MKISYKRLAQEMSEELSSSLMSAIQTEILPHAIGGCREVARVVLKFDSVHDALCLCCLGNNTDTGAFIHQCISMSFETRTIRVEKIR